MALCDRKTIYHIFGGLILFIFSPYMNIGTLSMNQWFVLNGTSILNCHFNTNQAFIIASILKSKPK